MAYDYFRFSMIRFGLRMTSHRVQRLQRGIVQHQGSIPEQPCVLDIADPRVTRHRVPARQRAMEPQKPRYGGMVHAHGNGLHCSYMGLFLSEVCISYSFKWSFVNTIPCFPEIIREKQY